VRPFCSGVRECGGGGWGKRIDLLKSTEAEMECCLEREGFRGGSAAAIRIAAPLKEAWLFDPLTEACNDACFH